MKKSTILIALIISTGTLLAQNRGGRGGGNQTQVVVVQTDNPVNGYNGNYFNNVGNLNNSNVQTTNVSFNYSQGIQQQSTGNSSRNVNRMSNTDLNINLSNDNVQTINYRGNRGGNTVVQEEVVLVSREGNSNLNYVFNDAPPVEEQQIAIEPVQQQMVIDNVDNGTPVNMDVNINAPDLSANVDLSLNLELNKQEKNEVVKTERVKETKVKEEKEVNLDVSLNMPDVSLKTVAKSSVAKKTTTIKTKRFKKRRGFGYQQHVSILQKIATKTSGIKKLLKKKKKKVTCSVVCYQF